MTAEVAILNKNAVALAADSAMTTGLGKIYPANKLFALTKHHPLGVMIYNKADFMGVPWETLIKMYRRRIGAKAFPTCEQYVADFLKFLGEHPICKAEQEAANLADIARATFADIRNRVFEALEENATSQRPPSSLEEGRALKEVIASQRLALSNMDRCESMKSARITKVLSENRLTIDNCIDRQFRGLRLSKSLRPSLRQILKFKILGAHRTGAFSGIVIAGFGEDEMFPTLFNVTTDGIIDGKVKHNVEARIDLGRKGSSSYLMPFAQGEMVYQFMEGIDPDYLEYSADSTREALVGFGKLVLEALGVNDANIDNAVRDVAEKVSRQHHEDAKRFRQEKLIRPTMSAVSLLPMEELADLAEALVSLTSLKRRVSLSQETVGGPIDVAIISKGDGLIWIKRKHYFEPRLNPSYFERQSLRRKQENSA